jgi:hypothetical protein
MNIFQYLYLRLTRQPFPAWFTLCRFSLTKYIHFHVEMAMGWSFGIVIRKEGYPFSARLEWTFYKIYGKIGFGKNKAEDIKY